MIPFSVLDLSPIPQGATASDAFRNSLDLAQHAERWGYHRYWLAEHHNMPGIASAATSIVIAHVASGTKTIRVGSGGIMLPNHSPLVIAEQFGTLASLFPGRIDLGLGRAPGTDTLTARALRRDLATSSDRFPEDVLELQHYFEEVQPGQKIRAVPGAGLQVPIWLLGSSLFSAQLAAHLGLPFAFASHFAPADMLDALRLYRAPLQALASNSTTRTPCSASMSIAADNRWRSSPSLHLAPAIVHQSSPRHARPNSSADRRHRRVLVSRGKSPGQPNSDRLRRRLPRNRSPRPAKLHSTSPIPTN